MLNKIWIKKLKDNLAQHKGSLAHALMAIALKSIACASNKGSLVTRAVNVQTVRMILGQRLRLVEKTNSKRLKQEFLNADAIANETSAS